MSKIFIIFKKISIVVVFAFFIVMIVLNGGEYSKSCLEGIKLWAFTVLPSLLPFFFLTTLLTKTDTLLSLSEKLSPLSKFLFKQKGISLYAFVMSIISGYPVGSRLVYDLHRQKIITDAESDKLSVLASTSGIIFIVGVVGNAMMKNQTIGLIIYLVHILSAILVGIIFRNHGSETKNDNLKINLSNNNSLYEMVYDSVISSLVVGGFISIFYVFTDVALNNNLLFPLQFIFDKILYFLGGNKEISRAFTAGIIECTRGCKELSTLTLSPLTISLTGALISFGGFSIIMQSLAFLQKAKVNAWFFIKGKIIQTLITFTLLYLTFTTLL